MECREHAGFSETCQRNKANAARIDRRAWHVMKCGGDERGNRKLVVVCGSDGAGSVQSRSGHAFAHTHRTAGRVEGCFENGSRHRMRADLSCDHRGGWRGVDIPAIAAARVLLQWVAAAYLFWLAWGFPSGTICETEVVESRRTRFVRGLLCNLLNPKAALFIAAVCAPFLSGNHPAWWPFAIWAIIVGMGIGLWSLWVLLLQWPPLSRR